MLLALTPALSRGEREVGGDMGEDAVEIGRHVVVPEAEGAIALRFDEASAGGRVSTY